MKYIRYAIFAVLMVILLTIAISNGQSVEVIVTPDWLPFIGGIKYSAPLFVSIYIAAAIGLILGYLFEYFREARIRRQASRAQRALKKTESELESLKKETGKHDDDVLAILE